MIPLPTAFVTVVRRHWLIATLVGAATVIRVLMMAAYPPAFWLYEDSGSYIDLAGDLGPSRWRPIGYPILLKVLSHTHSLAVVAGLQHVAGLALGVGVYAFLLRRGLPRLAAGLAAVPVLFDAIEIDIEQYILSETLFTTLLVAAIGVLLWTDKPSALACAAASLLVAGAWLTRPVALGVGVLLLGYLVLRRAGWRRVLTLAASMAVVMTGVFVWLDGRPSVYGSGSTGAFLYGRTAVIADCEHLVVPPEQQWLCPPYPRAWSGYYLWGYLPGEYRNDPANDDELRSFALAVITQQPGDYLALVTRESAPFFLPWRDLGPGFAPNARLWVPAASVRDDPSGQFLAGPGFSRDPVDRAAAPTATGLTTFLHWYGQHVRTPAPLTTVLIVAAIVALVRARRRDIWRDARDAALLVVVGVAFIVAQVATALYDQRYAVPVLPVLSVAAALCWQVLRRRADADADQAVPPDGVPTSSSSESR